MFFSKKDNKSTPRRTSTNNAELKELRVKARRRLIGALALVLLAFIVVPMLFDDPSPESKQTPLVIPAAPGSLSNNGDEQSFNQNFSSLDSDPISENGASGQITDTLDSDLGIDDIINNQADDALQTDSSNSQQSESTSKKSDAEQVTKKPVEKTNEVSKTEQSVKETQKQAKTDNRTDDGSVALALLEGKSIDELSKPKADTGSYYLQVAAYTTEQDANTRRDSLIKSGVSNAYVESGLSNGQTVYRLRVGPFNNKQAAQAAQTRLRTLGYPNGLISAK